jgi:hypothetical protein
MRSITTGRTVAAAVLTATALLAAPVAATTPAAAATCTAPELVNAYVDPGTVALGVAAPKGVTITVNVRKHGCTVSHVDTDLYTATAWVDTLAMEEVGTTDGVTTYETSGRINPGGFANRDAGQFHTDVYVTWGKQNTNDEGPTFRLLRAARVTANASPEPVRKGRTITVSGALTRANWETLKYAGYPGRTVRLQFKPTGGSWATVKTATSGKGGTVTTTVKATKDGCFRFVFPGSSTTAKATSGADCVDVR